MGNAHDSGGISRQKEKSRSALMAGRDFFIVAERGGDEPPLPIPYYSTL